MKDIEMIEKEYGELLNTKGIYNIEEFILLYERKVEPYLDLLSNFMIEKERQLSMSELSYILKVSKNKLKVMKQVFPDFEFACSAKNSFMDLKSQMYLINSLENNPKAKTIELGLIRYDEGYKPKNTEVDINIPRTLEIEFKDGELSEEEIEKKASE